MNKTEREALKIDRRLIGFAGLSNFGTNSSASRYVMFSNFLGQFIPLQNGEPKIVLSGLEKEFVKTLFHKKVKNDSKILSIIDRYDGKTADRISETTERFVIYLDLELEELNVISIPLMEKYNQKFGFEHRETEALNDLEWGDTLPKNTLLTRTNSQTDEGDLGIGMNVNMCLASFREGAEDAVIISDELAKKGAFKTYETATLSFGLSDLPLNLYGDDDTYKIIPDIGERIHDSGILFATRHFHEGDMDIAPALFSERHLRNPRPIFDKCYYAKDNSGIIKDIKVIHSPKNKKYAQWTDIDEQMIKYVKSLDDFHMQMINTVEELQKIYGLDMKIGDELHNLMVNIYSLKDPKLTNEKNREQLDLYTIETVIEYTHELQVGTKVTGLYGNKGVVAKIIPKHEMPIDGNGNRADAIMDQESIAARMNPSALYDSWFGAVSRKMQSEVVTNLSKLMDINKISNLHLLIKKDKELDKYINSKFKDILELLSYIDNDQFRVYSKANKNEIVELFKEIVLKEFYIVFPIDNRKKPFNVVRELKGTKFAPVKTVIDFSLDGIIDRSDEPVAIEPIYMLVLSKIADTWLAASTAKTNHFGVPISTSKANKKRQPWSPNPVKTGETETRLYQAYAGRKAIAELRDRSSSIITHKHMYENILKADTPTNIDKVIDRSVIDYSGDKPRNLLEAILNTGGVETVFMEEQI